MALARRQFLAALAGLGAAAVFDPHRVIFDMGRRLWLPQPANLLLESSVDAIQLEALAKEIPDLIFRNESVYSYFKRQAELAQAISGASPILGVRPFRVPQWQPVMSPSE